MTQTFCMRIRTIFRLCNGNSICCCCCCLLLRKLSHFLRCLFSISLLTVPFFYQMSTVPNRFVCLSLCMTKMCSFSFFIRSNSSWKCAIYTRQKVQWVNHQFLIAKHSNHLIASTLLLTFAQTRKKVSLHSQNNRFFLSIEFSTHVTTHVTRWEYASEYYEGYRFANNPIQPKANILKNA